MRGFQVLQEVARRVFERFLNAPLSSLFPPVCPTIIGFAMRLVFMGTPAYAIPVLARLLEAGHRVVGVVTRPDKPVGRGRRLSPPPVKLYAQEQAIPVLQPSSLRRRA